MYQNKWKREVFTIPNLLSLFRLALIPVYMQLYLHAAAPDQYHFAGLILAISCLTDAMDGIIARRFHMVSTVGKILDPLADKITQFSLILCLALRYPALKPVLALFTAKEVMQILLGVFYLRRGKMLPGALMAGKICTTVLFVSLILLVFFPDANSFAVRSIAMTDMVFLSISLVSYYFAYFGSDCKVQDLDTE